MSSDPESVVNALFDQNRFVFTDYPRVSFSAVEKRTVPEQPYRLLFLRSRAKLIIVAHTVRGTVYVYDDTNATPAVTRAFGDESSVAALDSTHFVVLENGDTLFVVSAADESGAPQVQPVLTVPIRPFLGVDRTVDVHLVPHLTRKLSLIDTVHDTVVTLKFDDDENFLTTVSTGKSNILSLVTPYALSYTTYSPIGSVAPLLIAYKIPYDPPAGHANVSFSNMVERSIKMGTFVMMDVYAVLEYTDSDAVLHLHTRKRNSEIQNTYNTTSTTAMTLPVTTEPGQVALLSTHLFVVTVPGSEQESLLFDARLTNPFSGEIAPIAQLPVITGSALVYPDALGGYVWFARRVDAEYRIAAGMPSNLQSRLQSRERAWLLQNGHVLEALGDNQEEVRQWLYPAVLQQIGWEQFVDVSVPYRIFDAVLTKKEQSWKTRLADKILNTTLGVDIQRRAALVGYVNGFVAQIELMFGRCQDGLQTKFTDAPNPIVNLNPYTELVYFLRMTDADVKSDLTNIYFHCASLRSASQAAVDALQAESGLPIHLAESMPPVYIENVRRLATALTAGAHFVFLQPVSETDSGVPMYRADAFSDSAALLDSSGNQTTTYKLLYRIIEQNALKP